MLIETIVMLFVAGFVLIAAYGHILVLQALLASMTTGTTVSPMPADCRPGLRPARS